MKDRMHLKKSEVLGLQIARGQDQKVVESISVRRANRVEPLSRATSVCSVKFGFPGAARLARFGQFPEIGIRLSKRYRFLVVTFIAENIETHDLAHQPACLEV